MKYAFPLAAGLLSTLCCGTPLIAGPSALNPVAEAYVKLVLKVGLYDPNYVDAYYGPDEWRPSDPRPASVAYPLEQLGREADSLLGRLKGLADSTPNQMRYECLLSQLAAVRGNVNRLAGKKMTFDEESMALFGTVAPHEKVNADSLLKLMDSILPGIGSIPARLDSLRARLVVPSSQVGNVMNAAMNEVRRRTRELVDLPANESVSLEYVTDKSWGAYNRYQGNAHSLISINLDIPFYVFYALSFAAYEGYPGHHLQGIVGEVRFVRDSGWTEFCISPLYCPQAIINEGMANYSLEALFSPADRLEFEISALYPLAGLDTSLAGLYSKVAEVLKAIGRAEISIIRDYIDGKIDRDATITRLTRDVLVDPKTAENYVEFYEEFRSYNITYRVGEDLVRQFVEDSTTAGDFAARRARYVKILTTPCTPSALSRGL